MPKYNLILNLPGFSIKKITGYHPILLDVQFNRLPRCGHCQSKQVRKKDSFIRLVRHEAIGARRTLLRFKAYKLYCHDCHKYSNQRFPGIGKHQRATDRLKALVFRQHTDGISQQQLAKNHKLGKATIERWYQRRYLRESKESIHKPCPCVLGIDEHFFSRKQGFATTFCDLKNHKIFDVVKGKYEKALFPYLQQLPGKDKVKVVCMDLCASYRQLVKRYFPNAKIVADRFHVIRLMQHQHMMTYRSIASQIKHNRGILALLRSNPNKLSDKKIKQRDRFLKLHPPIAAVYAFQQRLYRLLMIKTRRRALCIPLVSQLLDCIQQLKNSPFKHLRSLGKTFDLWKFEIARMWRFSKTNGITEGFHRKMKLIQRRAYGFRNFDNYRTRVKVLCG